jgi:hypothetical protein
VFVGVPVEQSKVVTSFESSLDVFVSRTTTDTCFDARCPLINVPHWMYVSTVYACPSGELDPVTERSAVHGLTPFAPKYTATLVDPLVAVQLHVAVLGVLLLRGPVLPHTGDWPPGQTAVSAT